MYTIDAPFVDFSLEAYFPNKDKIGRLTRASCKGKFAVLFFYPADFTFVCPTELADLAKRQEEFAKAGAEIIAVSTDSAVVHRAWRAQEALLQEVRFAMASDCGGTLSRTLGIYDEETGRSARASFVVDPEGILRAVEMVSDGIGRSAGELLRKVKALNYVRTHRGKVCPASWDEGAPTLSPSLKISGHVQEALAKSPAHAARKKKR